MHRLVLTIENNGVIYTPVTEGEIIWETERQGSPGILKFNVIKDEKLNFQEGNAVNFLSGDQKVFRGFVFTKGRTKDNIIQCTCYDQLRYFKNKDTYVYKNKTASEFIRMLAGDFNVAVGKIEDTEYKIVKRVEDNTTLFDMVQNALDETLRNRNRMFVLYDDFGKLTLKNIESMIVNLIIKEDTAENFDYKSSIDSNTYNKIKLAYDNEQTGKREIYIAKDSTNINAWGVLQYYEKINQRSNAKQKADGLLKLYNKKTRTLLVRNAFGDVSVRAGTSVIIALWLGDIILRNYMVIEKVTHRFENDEHFMDITLKGGDFIV